MLRGVGLGPGSDEVFSRPPSSRPTDQRRLAGGFDLCGDGALQAQRRLQVRHVVVAQAESKRQGQHFAAHHRVAVHVLVAALRSRRGWSFNLLSSVGTGSFDQGKDVPLAMAYEFVLLREGMVPLQPAAVREVIDDLWPRNRPRRLRETTWRVTHAAGFERRLRARPGPAPPTKRPRSATNTDSADAWFDALMLV